MVADSALMFEALVSGKADPIIEQKEEKVTRG